MMTTFAEKLLAKAAELEEQAKALRVAAAVMNGHGLATKQTGMAATLAAASKLRKQQAPSNGNGQQPHDYKKTRETRGQAQYDLLTARLAEGPQRAVDLAEHLHAHGIHVTQARVLQLLRRVDARKLGKGSQTRWQLPGAAPAPTPAESTLSPYAALQAQRAAKVEQILDILRANGGSMKIRELAAAARERGIQSLTGIVGLVRQGTLATRGRGSKRTYRLAT